MFPPKFPRTAWLRRIASVGAALLVSVPGALALTSNPVGARTVSLTTGPNFISAPLHNTPVYQGLAMNISGTSLRVTGSPFWTANELAPVDGFPQYIAIIKKDVSAAPALGTQGDWYYISANTADALTLASPAGALAPAVAFGSGDEIEIIKLTSLAELFGTGSSYLLTKDSDGISSTTTEDVIYTVAGTSFAEDIIYHDGSLGEGTEGYFVAGAGPFNGTTVTLAPDEAVFVFRLNAPVSPVSVGSAQTSYLSHYLAVGPNPLSTGFAVGTPVGTSNLEPSGWIHDVDGISNPADEDVAYSVTGTSFALDIFYTDLLPGWVVAGDEAPTFPFKPGTGYFFFKKGAATIWRQAPAF